MNSNLIAPPRTAVTPATRPLAFNELRRGNALHPGYRVVDQWLRGTNGAILERRHLAADELFRRRGITFTLPKEGSAERLIPFDVIPRSIGASEWTRVAEGCVQRVKALNAFLEDIYHDQEIIRAGIIPAAEILGNKLYRPEAQGMPAPNGVHACIAGVDVVRTGPDDWYVLEDNLRTPSGVSYMIENRAAMRRLFPDFFANQPVLPVDHYPDLLLRALRESAPAGVDAPTVVVMTPGAGNSAFFEHAFLAQRMGVPLVEGQDLCIERGRVWMRTTCGLRRVDVIYRRIDDEFLDPAAFHPESVLGVRGLVEVARAGGVTISNAIGNGVADDKATYLHVPAMIRFYLGEEPILNNVPTYRLSDAAERAYVLEHLDELVVKEVHGSGGYGMLVGPAATAAERAAYRERILGDPAAFIAQPTLALSTCPTFVGEGIAPRHVDLRPYVLSGRTVALVPGALTRVALKEGSLVVNSSQGGGTKDTWVVADA
jgi:uncharacterized circularly permuted ATP-grasp superfamily protein